MNFFCFYCFENLSIAHNFGTTGPIQVGFSAKCTSPNARFNQIENLMLFDFLQIASHIVHTSPKRQIVIMYYISNLLFDITYILQVVWLPSSIQTLYRLSLCYQELLYFVQQVSNSFHLSYTSPYEGKKKKNCWLDITCLTLKFGLTLNFFLSNFQGKFLMVSLFSPKIYLTFSHVSMSYAQLHFNISAR